jgi:carbohydrate esterase-like sialic acid-specific acetylesterase
MMCSSTRLPWTVFLFVALGGCGVREIDLAPQPAPAGGGPGGAPAGPPPVGGSGGAGGSSNEGPRPDAGAAGGDTGGGKAPDGAATGGGTIDAAPPSTPPPPSGVTVSINGMTIPKEKAIVILHIGHSNMAGRAQGPADLMPYFYGTHPNLWRYQKGGVWSPAKEWLCPDGAPDKNFPQGAGPGMALLRQGLTVAPDSYFISIGTGKSLDFGASCFSFRKGGLFFNEAIDPALELKGKVTFGGLFVMLGYDGRSDAKAQNGGYLACMKGLAADWRAALGEPDLPFIVGDYERGATGGFSPTSAGAKQVIAQLAQVPMNVPHSFLIATDGVTMQDNHHYNMTGHRQWAERGFAGMASSGMLPWATVKP